MKVEYLYATTFPLIHAQSVTDSEADTDNTLQEHMAFVSVSVFDNSQMNFPFKCRAVKSSVLRVAARLACDVGKMCTTLRKLPNHGGTIHNTIIP
jgi:hypothetical protein